MICYTVEEIIPHSMVIVAMTFCWEEFVMTRSMAVKAIATSALSVTMALTFILFFLDMTVLNVNQHGSCQDPNWCQFFTYVLLSVVPVFGQYILSLIYSPVLISWWTSILFFQFGGQSFIKYHLLILIEISPVWSISAATSGFCSTRDFLFFSYGLLLCI